MGLFSKKAPEVVVHPDIERVVLVRSDMPSVVAHLERYSSLAPASTTARRTGGLAACGSWTAIRLPAAAHPWQLHNLALWMLDCPGVGDSVIARSAASPDHPAYWLVPDPDIPDALCGWDDDGGAWTVLVPSNDIHRGDAVPVPRSIVIPDGFSEWHRIEIHLEDPGAEQNPHNDSTRRSRDQLQRCQVWF